MCFLIICISNPKKDKIENEDEICNMCFFVAIKTPTLAKVVAAITFVITHVAKEP